jgi:hypothetical protein
MRSAPSQVPGSSASPSSSGNSSPPAPAGGAAPRQPAAAPRAAERDDSPRVAGSEASVGNAAAAPARAAAPGGGQAGWDVELGATRASKKGRGLMGSAKVQPLVRAPPPQPPLPPPMRTRLPRSAHVSVGPDVACGPRRVRTDACVAESAAACTRYPPRSCARRQQVWRARPRRPLIPCSATPARPPGNRRASGLGAHARARGRAQTDASAAAAAPRKVVLKSGGGVSIPSSLLSLALLSAMVFYFYVRIAFTLDTGALGYSIFVLVVEVLAATSMLPHLIYLLPKKARAGHALPSPPGARAAVRPPRRAPRPMPASGQARARCSRPRRAGQDAAARRSYGLFQGAAAVIALYPTGFAACTNLRPARVPCCLRPGKHAARCGSRAALRR